MIRLSVLLGAATWSGSNFLCFRLPQHISKQSFYNYSCVNGALKVCILSLKDFTWYLSKGKSESLGRNDRNTRFVKPVNKQSKRSWQHSVYLLFLRSDDLAVLLVVLALCEQKGASESLSLKQQFASNMGNLGIGTSAKVLLFTKTYLNY